MSTPATSGAGLRSRNLRTVAALAGLFLVPLALSFILYYSGWRPPGSAAHGELFDPPRSLPTVALPTMTDSAGASPVLAEKWALFYIGDGVCNDACRNALYEMRQTRLLLNQDMGRVRRVFLATAHCCNRELLEREHPGLEVFDASGGEGARLLREFPAEDRDDAVFIVDPLGNLVLRFDSRQNPRGLLQDLKKLLRLSHIG